MGIWTILGIVGFITGWLIAEAATSGHPVAIVLASGGCVLCVLGLKKVMQ